MDCIFIDDESTARIILKQLSEQVDHLDVVGVFSNALEAIKFLNKNTVDVIFLDIHMSDFSGFDFIQTLKNPPRIILTTSDKNFAIEAFEYDCIVDYLVKPLTLSRFRKAVHKAKVLSIETRAVNDIIPAVVNPSEKELFVNIDRRLIKIEFATISYVEAKGDYILVKTEKKNYTVHSTLKKIEEKLPKNIFLKVHRSYIINTNKIIDIEDNSVLIGKKVIPVSRSNRPELMRTLNLL